MPAGLLVQPTLLGWGDPAYDDTFTGLTRIELGRGAWLEHQPAWVSGHDELFARLLDEARWEAGRRPMYDRMVAVPRLVSAAPTSGPTADLLGGMADRLSRHYGVVMSQITLALYRSGADSVAWHGDRVARERLVSLMATVSLGSPRPFRLRPTGGGGSRGLILGPGDLVVMGGTCQRTWQHAVPKVASAGPRIVVMFRPDWGRADPLDPPAPPGKEVAAALS